MKQLKPLKNHLVQARIDDNELADFNTVKQLLGAKNSSQAIRMMVLDEKTVEQVKRKWHRNNHIDVIQLISQLDAGRQLPMAEVLSGLTNDQTSAQLKFVQAQFVDIQNQIEGVLLGVTRAGNNLNQISHNLNIARQQVMQEDADFADADLWNWVANELARSHQVLSLIQQKIIDFKIQLGSNKEDETHGRVNNA